MHQEELTKLYRSYTGRNPEEMIEFPSSGSNRRYFRLIGSPTLIGVAGESSDENRAFIYLSDHFAQKNLPVPEVVKVSDSGLYYLQSDLGNTLLFDAIAHGRTTREFDDKERKLLHQTIRLLPHIQFEGAEGLDFAQCYQASEFNKRSILWDLNYFKYCFLKTTGIDFNENLLEDDFQKMADLLLMDCSHTFMYRDFQSRNVMIKDDRPWLIDYQGGRRGPIYYDVASFLWQAKANYPEALRQELLSAYLDELQHFQTIDEAHFRERLHHFVLFRTLQVLGAYGFRGYFEQKPHFIESVPYAIDNLRALLQKETEAYPYLASVLFKMVALKRFAPAAPKPALVVDVSSFSYKKGIPEDTSGNGGGFVFDCRAIHNPGKYERYKRLTGLDKPVIEFLEEDGEITTFLKHVYALVDASTQRYMERGFTHLSISFGCTGGQHRSVYSAQHVAEHLHEHFGVEVMLEHREQGIKQRFKAVKK